MKRLRAFFHSRYPLAIFSGLLLGISFPKIGISGFAWVAPAIILAAASGKSGKTAFRIGYVAGLAHYLISLYWLLLIPVAWFPILGWAALSAFLSLFMAVWVWLGWKFFPIFAMEESTAGIVQGLTGHFFSVSWIRRLIWTLSCAALWVAMEMTIARIFSGFPWNLLGSSQFQMIPLIQIASFTGIYGVSFLLVWTSLCCLSALLSIIRQPARRSAWVAEIILPLIVVFSIFTAGSRHILNQPAGVRNVSISLIQPSIPQTLIWDSRGDYERFQQLLELSQKSMAAQPQIVIWPEAAVPGLIRIQRDISEPVLSFAKSNHVWMVIGGDDFEPHRAAKTLQDSDFFNGSFLINPEGQVVETYHKRNLVIFGEYIPLIQWLPFIKYFTPITGGFVAGKKSVPFKLAGLDVDLSVLICFEDVFPQLAREYVSDDTDFLVNITNDGWFGEGAAQWQHAAAATFRAVENGVPLVRCSNNGLTCWIDASGRIRQFFKDDNHGIYGRGFMSAQIPLLASGIKPSATFYRKYGDVFGWTCVGAIGFRLIRLWLKRKSMTPSNR